MKMARYFKQYHNIHVWLVLIVLIYLLTDRYVSAITPLRQSVNIIYNEMPGILSIKQGTEPLPPKLVNDGTKSLAVINILDDKRLISADLKIDTSRRMLHKAYDLPLFKTGKRCLAYDILDFRTSILIYKVDKSNSDCIKDYINTLKRNGWKVTAETSSDNQHNLYRVYKHDNALIISVSKHLKFDYVTLWLTYYNQMQGAIR